MPASFLAICRGLTIHPAVKVSEEVNSAMLGTRWYNFEPHYTDLEHHNAHFAQLHRQTDSVVPV